MNDEVLRLEAVSQVFGLGTDNEVRALDGIDVSVNRGDFLVIVGENGSGKTCLLNVIYSGGMTAGKVFIKGHNISDVPEYRRAKYISTVTQRPEDGTVGEFSVFENIVLASLKQRRPGFRSALQKTSRKEYEKQFRSIGVPLEARLDSPSMQLSGGERQLICVLMALIGHPAILLCDEATASIDVARCTIIESLVQAFAQQEGIPVLWITHDPAQVRRLGNRLVVLRQGRVMSEFDSCRKASLTYEQIASLIHGRQPSAAV